MEGLINSRGIGAVCSLSSEYPKRRKAISSAFFKGKLQSLTKIIKKELLEHIKELQDSNAKEIDLPESH